MRNVERSCRHDPQRTRTIGRPLPGRDCCIAVDGEVVDEAQVGELFAPPLGMDGYLADDGALAVVDRCAAGWLPVTQLDAGRSHHLPRTQPRRGDPGAGELYPPRSSR